MSKVGKPFSGVAQMNHLCQNWVDSPQGKKPRRGWGANNRDSCTVPVRRARRNRSVPHLIPCTPQFGRNLRHSSALLAAGAPLQARVGRVGGGLMLLLLDACSRLNVRLAAPLCIDCERDGQIPQNAPPSPPRLFPMTKLVHSGTFAHRLTSRPAPLTVACDVIARPSSIPVGIQHQPDPGAEGTAEHSSATSCTLTPGPKKTRSDRAVGFEVTGIIPRSCQSPDEEKWGPRSVLLAARGHGATARVQRRRMRL